MNFVALGVYFICSAAKFVTFYLANLDITSGAKRTATGALLRCAHYPSGVC